MIISGIDRLFINVPDLDKALDMYHGIIGMEVVSKGPLDPSLLTGLWGLADSVKGRSACVKNAKQSTAIELVELRPALREGIRDNAATYDHGFFDVAFLVSDAAIVEKKIREKGYTFFTEPYRYPTWPDGEEAIEGFVNGPAGEFIAVIVLFNPPVMDEQKLEGDFWTILDMAQIVGDMDEAFLFYRDALGLTLLSDNTRIPPGFLDEALHYPPGTKARIAMFNHPQSNGPVVELVETDADGKDLGASPNDLGIFMIAFESSDLMRDLAIIKEKGFQVINGPIQIETCLHGTVKAVDIEGPSKIRVELFQKV